MSLHALTPEDVQLSRNLGMYTLPGVAEAYPELAAMVRVLYRDRFTLLPFIPSDWFPQVTELLGKNGNMIMPVPAYDGQGVPSAGMPIWLDNDAKRQAWEEARKNLLSAYMKFTQNQIDIGREELNRLYANVAFWDRLVKAAQFIADIPKNIAFAGFKVLWPWLLIGGIALFAWPRIKDMMAGRSSSREE